MSDSQQIEPLPGDPQRQAVDTIHGYSYQIWHSVWAWLSLNEKEMLFLEGAEDFDVISKQDATATQIKASSKNITLRSHDVVSAINHYWQLHSPQPERKIHFKFLTRGGIGKEKGSPFGKNIKGIELWKQCEREEERVGNIRDFLLKDEQLSDSLRKYLENADPQAIQADLISNIDWVTGSGSIDQPRSWIEKKLILHGDKYKIPPEDSRLVVSRLYTEASQVATRKIDRYLDRAKFLEIFAEETRISVSKADYEKSAANALVGKVLPLTGSRINPAYSISDYHLSTTVPPLPENYSLREKLAGGFLSQLKRDGIICLTGSTGGGKTTLAKILTTKIEDDWIWRSISGLSPLEIGSILDWLLTETTNSKCYNLVLDDIDLKSSSSRTFETQLEMLLYTYLQARGHIIITSQRPISSRVQSTLALEEKLNQEVPPFTEKELIEFCITFGCPDRDYAKAWGTIIMMKTYGHPQLVHAYLIHLANEKWPDIDFASIFELPQTVLKTKRESQQLLIILKDEEKTLLYRLSLLTYAFRRDQSISIGTIVPAINNPGSVFDGLVGPWIEALSNEYYKLSPLLKNTAVDIWAEELVKEMHAHIAEAIANAGNLTLREASSIFMHALVGSNTQALVGVIHSLLKAEGKELQNVASHFKWIAVAGTDPARPFYKDNSTINHLIRSFQFKVVSVIDPIKAAKLIDIWDNELTPSEPVILYLLQRISLCSLVLIRDEVPLSPIILFKYLSELWSIENRIKNDTDLEKAYSELSDHDGLFTDKDPYDILPRMIIYRSNTKEYLLEFIDSISDLEIDHREKYLSYLRNNEKDADILITQCWSHETKQGDPNWESCIENLKKTILKATEWDVSCLAVAAARGIGIILNEFLGESEESMKSINHYIKQLGESNLLSDVKATILYNQGNYAEALAIWERFLPVWLEQAESYDLNPMFSMRNAAIAYGYLDDFEQSAVSFMAAYEHAKNMNKSTLSIGLLADAGYAHWKAGDHARALDVLSKALTKLEGYEIESAPSDIFILNKLVGNTILWINRYYSDGSEFEIAEPVPGTCSNTDPNPEIANLPHSHIAISWALLAEYEYSVTDNDQIVRAANERIDYNSPVHAYSLMARLNMVRIFKYGHYDQLPEVVRQLDMIGSASNQLRSKDVSSEEDIKFFVQYDNDLPLGSVLGYSVFLGALIGTVCKDDLASELIASWLSQIPHVKNNMPFIEWLNSITDILGLTGKQAMEIVSDMECERDKRIAASLTLISDVNNHPNYLIYGQLSLLDFSFNTLYKAYKIDIGHLLATIFSKQWTKKIKFRAVLKAPQVTVPAIEKACKGGNSGFLKAASILLAAQPATSISINTDYRKMLQGIGREGSV